MNILVRPSPVTSRCIPSVQRIRCNSPGISPVPVPTPFSLGCFPCLSLSPKLQGPFFCLYDLIPGPIFSKAHFFCLCDLLNKLSLRVWILALNSFLATTQVLLLLNWLRKIKQRLRKIRKNAPIWGTPPSLWENIWKNNLVEGMKTYRNKCSFPLAQ